MTEKTNVRIFAAVTETDDGQWYGTINLEVNGEITETYESNKRFYTEEACRAFTREAFEAMVDAWNDDAEDLTVH